MSHSNEVNERKKCPTNTTTELDLCDEHWVISSNFKAFDKFEIVIKFTSYFMPTIIYQQSSVWPGDNKHWLFLWLDSLTAKWLLSNWKRTE